MWLDFGVKFYMYITSWNVHAYALFHEHSLDYYFDFYKMHIIRC